MYDTGASSDVSIFGTKQTLNRSPITQLIGIWLIRIRKKLHSGTSRDTVVSSALDQYRAVGHNTEGETYYEYETIVSESHERFCGLREYRVMDCLMQYVARGRRGHGPA